MKVTIFLLAVLASYAVAFFATAIMIRAAEEAQRWRTHRALRNLAERLSDQQGREAQRWN